MRMIDEYFGQDLVSVLNLQSITDTPLNGAEYEIRSVAPVLLLILLTLKTLSLNHSSTHTWTSRHGPKSFETEA